MKKVLFITAFLAIGTFANAQTQTIYSQLKLNTVNDGTASDSLVLVQGTDKIVRKIPLSSISSSTEIPSLQEVTNNGNVTSHPIYAKEFRVESNADSLMILNNRYFSIGDLGKDYSGNWNRFFSVFDPNNYDDGFSMYSYNSKETKSIDVTAYAGYVRLSPWFDLDNSKYSNLEIKDNIFYQGSGNKMGTLIGNYTQYFGEAMLGVIEDNLVYRTYNDPEAPDYTNWLRIHPSESRIYLDTEKLVFNELISLTTSGVTEPETIDFPNESGVLLLENRDFAPYGSYSFGGQYGGYAEDLRQFKFETLGNGVDGFNSRFALNINPEEGASLVGSNTTNTTQGIIGVSTADVHMAAVDDIIGNSSYSLTADKATFRFTNVADGCDSYNFLPASRSNASEDSYYYMPTIVGTGYLGIIGQTAPASATATGSVGEIRVTSTYIYVCTATNTWVRAPLATW